MSDALHTYSCHMRCIGGEFEHALARVTVVSPPVDAAGMLPLALAEMQRKSSLGVNAADWALDYFNLLGVEA